MSKPEEPSAAEGVGYLAMSLATVVVRTAVFCRIWNWYMPSLELPWAGTFLL